MPPPPAPRPHVVNVPGEDADEEEVDDNELPYDDDDGQPRGPPPPRNAADAGAAAQEELRLGPRRRLDGAAVEDVAIRRQVTTHFKIAEGFKITEAIHQHFADFLGVGTDSAKGKWAFRPGATITQPV